MLHPQSNAINPGTKCVKPALPYKVAAEKTEHDRFSILRLTSPYITLLYPTVPRKGRPLKVEEGLALSAAHAPREPSNSCASVDSHWPTLQTAGQRSPALVDNRFMLTACFVSDLHLLSPRSMAPKWMPAIDAACRDSELIVLGGDIFDFRWATLGGHSATLLAVQTWLLSLLKRHSHSRVVYILGNHDSHPDMQSLLQELVHEHPHLSWHAESYQIGDCYFCHGDVLDAGGPALLDRYRRKFHDERQASRAAHNIYNAAVAMRLHRTLPTLFHRPKATCSRLSEFLELEKHPSGPRIERVFFGHTHVPIYELPLGSVHYYNPGAALRHMNFAPITFQIESVSANGI